MWTPWTVTDCHRLSPVKLMFKVRETQMRNSGDPSISTTKMGQSSNSIKTPSEGRPLALGEIHLPQKVTWITRYAVQLYLEKHTGTEYDLCPHFIFQTKASKPYPGTLHELHPSAPGIISTRLLNCSKENKTCAYVKLLLIYWLYIAFQPTKTPNSKTEVVNSHRFQGSNLLHKKEE